MLGAHLGATLVESTDPLWPDDAGIENMKTSYTRALAELVPVFFPNLLYRLNNQGQPVFPEFAAAIKPTEFAPGKTVRIGNARAGRLHGGLGGGAHPAAGELNIRTIQTAGRRAAVPVSRRAVPRRGAPRTGRRAGSRRRSSTGRR